MSKKQSESPKERINVTYKPADGDVNEEVEIPYKMLVLETLTLMKSLQRLKIKSLSM